MRCPKCHYISFESGDRCRNCGYEFSLATPDGGRPPVIDELPLQDVDATPHPPIDLSFRNADRPAASQPTPLDTPRLPALHPGARPAPDRDLPLFGRASPPATDARDDDDAPLIRPSAVPRAPLAVRRPTPDAQRLRARYTPEESPRLDLGAPGTLTVEATPLQPAGPAVLEDAPPARRLLAAAIDLSVIGGIDLGVLYFTLKLCALPLAAPSLVELPPVPFFGFLLLIDAGYAIAFTAIVGQTIGKMATGLKVVNTDEGLSSSTHPNVGFSILRTAAYAASLLPLGLGFLPAFIGSDRRALHDRLAETRVVRA
jgi:uncharacterized RDD family membrane protein YckC